MEAGDRFELPMHLAYETGVVTTLPAILYMLGVRDRIRTCMKGICNPVPNRSATHAHKNEFVSCSTTLIGTIHPIALVRTGVGTSLGILNIGAPLHLRYSNPPYFCTRLTFEESSQRVFLLLTLTKLGDAWESRTPVFG